ncbi:glycerophosphodiester phosphodiesterase [Sphingobium sp. CAP-1]|uniref:glycerophosphodiester phosphodiesterase n=1 Tax=Sphingobium sp. CAP-1 TaxID=2676077 RepID=UPI0012BB24CB|nr:glycerophosphodiester phosphodiesterase [Sphingobium sp. CAP-1]QGP79446.1 glycerophosphodiester phosphodiesterase [Sphingobium sp. CAP-1]
MIGRGLARIGLILLMSLIPLSTAPAAMAADPILIAHRGASGERPEHTLGAYERAIDQGADYVEPDLVLTKDGVLVARHENEISGTTDVADHPEFADRRTSKTIDGVAMTGWFTEDFTLAELRTLRARERLPDLRPANTRFNDLYLIPTFEEILKLVRAKEAETGRRIGLYPETKHPGYFAGIGLPHQAALLDLLSRYGYQSEADPIFIQSFEVGNLKALRAATRLRLIQLVDADGGPADLPGTSYADMLTVQGLTAIAAYADGIGPSAAQVIAPEGPTALVGRAHDAGLQVHVWTLRMENSFLPAQYQRADDPQGRGDFASWVRAIVAAGVDGLFSDFPGQARAAMEPVR